MKIYKVLNVHGDLYSLYNGMPNKVVECDLDDYVVYKNGNYKSIRYLYNSNLPIKWQDWKESYCASSSKPETLSTNDLIGGQWLLLDLNKTCDYNHDYGFAWFKEIMEILGMKTHYEGNKKKVSRDSRGTLLEGTNEFLGTWGEANQRNAEMFRQAQYQNQVVQNWTSWNMPPKW